MDKDYIEDEEQFETFCSEHRIRKDIENPPYEYPCIIVYKEIMGWYDYTYVYLNDF
jgi:hypothetical protein